MTITDTPEWRALRGHADDVQRTSLRALFAADPARADRFTFPVGDLHVDLSKQRVDTTTISLLLALADRAGVTSRRDAMFAGERINATEQRAVLHTALRAARGATVMVDGHNVVPDVYDDKGAANARLLPNIQTGKSLTGQLGGLAQIGYGLASGNPIPVVTGLATAGLSSPILASKAVGAADIAEQAVKYGFDNQVVGRIGGQATRRIVGGE